MYCRPNWTVRRERLLPLAWATMLVVGGVLAPEAGAAEKATPPRVIVDFEDAEAVRLRPLQSQASRLAADGGHRFYPDLAWPAIAAVASSWNAKAGSG